MEMRLISPRIGIFTGRVSEMERANAFGAFCWQKPLKLSYLQNMVCSHHEFILGKRMQLGNELP
jgi:hypothetical protein